MTPSLCSCAPNMLSIVGCITVSFNLIVLWIFMFVLFVSETVLNVTMVPSMARIYWMRVSVCIWNVIHFDVWCALCIAIDVCINLRAAIARLYLHYFKMIQFLIFILFNYLNTWNLVHANQLRFGLSIGSVNGNGCMALNVVNCAKIELTTTDGNRMQTDYPIIAMHECEAFHWRHHAAMQLCCCCSMSCRWKDTKNRIQNRD